MKNITLTMILAFILVGCSRIQPNYLEPGAVFPSLGLAESNIKLAAYFYPVEGHIILDMAPVIDTLFGKGEIRLPYGEYDAFAHTNSKKFLQSGMDKYSTAELSLATSDDIAPFTKSGEIEYIVQSDSLYLAQMENISVTKEIPDYTIEMAPKLASVTVKLVIPIRGIEEIVGAKASLSGVAKTINLSTGEIGITETASTIFDFDITSTGIEATICCLGLPKGETLFNFIDIAFTDKSGETTRDHKLDITSKISDEVRQNGGEVVLDEIVLQAGTMQLAIDSWADHGDLLARFYLVGAPEDTEQPMKTFSATDDKVNLSFGEYNAFLHSDTNNDKFRYQGMDQYSTAKVSLPLLIADDGTLAPLPVAEYVVSASNLYITQIEKFALTNEAPEFKTTAATEKPVLIPIKIKFTIPVTGLDVVTEAKASLSGMVESISLSTSERVGESLMAFDIDDIITSATKITATINCFGILPESAITLKLGFHFTNGSVHVETINVSDLLTQEIRKLGGDVTYAGDKIKLTMPQNPSIGGWGGSVNGEDDKVIDPEL